MGVPKEEIQQSRQARCRPREKEALNICWGKKDGSGNTGQLGRCCRRYYRYCDIWFLAVVFPYVIYYFVFDLISCSIHHYAFIGHFCWNQFSINKKHGPKCKLSRVIQCRLRSYITFNSPWFLRRGYETHAISVFLSFQKRMKNKFKTHSYI